jgi:hypothetical protein
MDDKEQQGGGPSIGGWNLDSVGRFVANIGLPSVIVLALLWPAIQLINAVTASMPMQAQAAKDQAEAAKMMSVVMAEWRAESKEDKRLLIEAIRAIGGKAGAAP